MRRRLRRGLHVCQGHGDLVLGERGVVRIDETVLLGDEDVRHFGSGERGCSFLAVPGGDARHLRVGEGAQFFDLVALHTAGSQVTLVAPQAVAAHGVEVPVEQEVRRQHQRGEGTQGSDQRADRATEHVVERAGDVRSQKARGGRAARPAGDAAGLNVDDEGEAQREREDPQAAGEGSFEFVGDEPDRPPDQHHQRQHEGGDETEEVVQGDDHDLHHTVRRRARYRHMVVAQGRQTEHRQGNRYQGHRPIELHFGWLPQRNRLRAHLELPCVTARLEGPRPSTGREM